MITRVTTYKDLSKWTDAFVKGSFELMFLIGDPGKAKSYGIKLLVEKQAALDKVSRAKAALKLAEANRKAAGKKGKKKPAVDPTKDPNYQKKPDDHDPTPLYIEGGAVTAFKLYQELYRHLDEYVVLDDVDAVYSDRALVRLLKALCQTEKVKTVGWWTDSRQLEKHDIPTKFKTRSRVCIIANQWKTLSDHVGSLVSRGMLIYFDPPVKEVYDYIIKEKVVTDKEVLKFVNDNLWMAQKIDMRDVINAVTAKKAKLDWRDALGQSLGIRDMMLVQKLDADKSYHTTEQRVSEFMRLTGLSRPMYFAASKKLSEAKSARDASKSKGKPKGKPGKIIATQMA